MSGVRRKGASSAGSRFSSVWKVARDSSLLRLCSVWTQPLLPSGRSEGWEGRSAPSGVVGKGGGSEGGLEEPGSVLFHCERGDISTPDGAEHAALSWEACFALSVWEGSRRLLLRVCLNLRSMRGKSFSVRKSDVRSDTRYVWRLRFNTSASEEMETRDVSSHRSESDSHTDTHLESEHFTATWGSRCSPLITESLNQIIRLHFKLQPQI